MMRNNKATRKQPAVTRCAFCTMKRVASFYAHSNACPMRAAQRAAVTWAASELKRVAKKMSSQEAADYILSEVSRRAFGIACQDAVMKELGLQFTQPADNDEVEELDCEEVEND